MATAPWCVMFLDWLSVRTGVDVPQGAYTPDVARAWQKAGRWSSRPKVGAWVFFDWDGGVVDHVGIVETINRDGSIVTIEGNRADRVSRVRRIRGIVGYGLPRY